MYIYLDDDRENRPTPPGWTRFVNAVDLISFLQDMPENKITKISLDNDLGAYQLEGYDVLKWLINHADTQHIDHINFHTANIVARRGMLQSMSSAKRHHRFVNTSVHSQLPYSPKNPNPFYER